MNIFGVGGWELVFVIIIAMVVMGPERVAKHMFTLGRWTRRMMVIYNQARAALRDELLSIDDGETLEGLKQVRDDIQDLRTSINPRQIATDLNQEVRQTMNSVEQAVQTAADETNILPPTPAVPPSNSIAPPPPAPTVQKKAAQHDAWLPPSPDTPADA